MKWSLGLEHGGVSQQAAVVCGGGWLASGLRMLWGF